MRILSRALGFGAVLLAAPLAAPPAEAASPPPYHLAADAGHGPLQPVDWSRRHGGWDDDDRDDDDDDWDDDRRRHDRWGHGNHWRPGWNGPGPSWPGSNWQGHAPHFRPQPLPVWVIEHRLRRQHVYPAGRIVLRQGYYVVPVHDRHGRQVLLAVDPLTAAILGRVRHW